jgi:hypothetical protein
MTEWPERSESFCTSLAEAAWSVPVRRASVAAACGPVAAYYATTHR